MKPADIKDIFADLDDETLDIVCRNIKPKLTAAIHNVNRKLEATATSVAKLSPQPSKIFESFRLCPASRISVVLIGQDPYIKPGQAMGLSFSIPNGMTISPSLRNIFKVIGRNESNTDLTDWSKQGVLLLNKSLTTILGKSNEHKDCWDDYTNALVSQISLIGRPLVFILLGNEAQSLTNLIVPGHHILKWGHPSPMNSANKTENPKNFKYCTVFEDCNKILAGLGRPTINWVGTPADPETPLINAEIPPNTLWIFTDGAAIGNGRAHCKATWGCYITDSVTEVKIGGVVPPANIPGQKFTASNNRGELLALLEGLRYIPGDFKFSQIRVVSDSEYSVNCITKWVVTWLANPDKMEGKKNTDLIIPAHKLYKEISKNYPIQINHLEAVSGLKSHSSEPNRSLAPVIWFYWNGNNCADEICNQYMKQCKK